MKKNNKIILIGIFFALFNLRGNDFDPIPLDFQYKLTNVSNALSIVDVGMNTNELSIALNSNHSNIVDPNAFFGIVANKGSGVQSLYKKFFINNLAVIMEEGKLGMSHYIFSENDMDFEDAATVRSQTNYEQKLPLVIKYLYNKHGTNYQIIKRRNSNPEAPKEHKMVTPFIYWVDGDKVYAFYYTRLVDAAVNNLPYYGYMQFHKKRTFDFIKDETEKELKFYKIQLILM